MDTKSGVKAFIVAGTRSGEGKSTVTMGIMKALIRRGLGVQPFKAGPDYIDAGLLGSVCRRPCYNLDTWMMGDEGVRETFLKNLRNTDVAVIEGVMGLFDGKGDDDQAGSTAHLSKVLDIPVLLVVDAWAMAGSAAALVKGYAEFDGDTKILGVVFNRVNSQDHFDMLKSAVERSTGIRVFGRLPLEDSLLLPERHLGLVTAGDIEAGGLKDFAGPAGTAVERYFDIEGLLNEAPSVETPVEASKDNSPVTSDKQRPLIAVARDRVFSFYYQENLDILKELGAELVFFSPLEDEGLPENASGLYIGGGYPELHAKALEDNVSMRSAVKRFATQGFPVYAECGGLMYLGNKLRDIEGEDYEMAGLFPWTSRMLKGLKALGYREVRLKGRPPFLKGFSRQSSRYVVRGHEFHHSEIVSPTEGFERAYIPSCQGSCRGYVFKRTLASYVHLHFASNPRFAADFVWASARMARRSKP